jgi:hypothetical protein
MIMNSSTCISKQTRINWFVSLLVLLSAIVVFLSSIYFLYLPTGGYQGGRNLYYGTTILFDRETWEALHTWGSIIFIAAIFIHLPLHWRWISGTTKRISSSFQKNGSTMNLKVRWNIAVDSIIAISFFIATVSGIYFLIFPKHGGSEWLFSASTWDLIHTWSGIVMVLAAMAHFFIHWNWIRKITPKVVNFPIRKEIMQQSNEPSAMNGSIFLKT